MSDLSKRLREEHRETPHNFYRGVPGGQCWYCGRPWPCDPILAAAEIEALEQKVKELEHNLSMRSWWPNEDETTRRIVCQNCGFDTPLKRWDSRPIEEALEARVADRAGGEVMAWVLLGLLIVNATIDYCRLQQLRAIKEFMARMETRLPRLRRGLEEK